MPIVIQIVGRPGTGSLHRSIAPPDHPPFELKIFRYNSFQKSLLKRMATKFDEIMVSKIVKLSDDMEFEEDEFNFGIKNMDFEAQLKVWCHF